jgi:hypothetical protein
LRPIHGIDPRGVQFEGKQKMPGGRVGSVRTDYAVKQTGIAAKRNESND